MYLIELDSILWFCVNCKYQINLYAVYWMIFHKYTTGAKNKFYCKKVVLNIANPSLVNITLHFFFVGNLWNLLEVRHCRRKTTMEIELLIGSANMHVTGLHGRSCAGALSMCQQEMVWIIVCVRQLWKCVSEGRSACFITARGLFFP